MVPWFCMVIICLIFYFNACSNVNVHTKEYIWLEQVCMYQSWSQEDSLFTWWHQWDTVITRYHHTVYLNNLLDRYIIWLNCHTFCHDWSRIKFFQCCCSQSQAIGDLRIGPRPPNHLSIRLSIRPSWTLIPEWNQFKILLLFIMVHPIMFLVCIAHQHPWPIFDLGHDLLSISCIGFWTPIPKWNKLGSCYLAHWCILSRPCLGYFRQHWVVSLRLKGIYNVHVANQKIYIHVEEKCL